MERFVDYRLNSVALDDDHCTICSLVVVCFRWSVDFVLYCDSGDVKAVEGDTSFPPGPTMRGEEGIPPQRREEGEVRLKPVSMAAVASELDFHRQIFADSDGRGYGLAFAGVSVVQSHCDSFALPDPWYTRWNGDLESDFWHGPVPFHLWV